MAILTARWESANGFDSRNRAALRDDLAQIRALYSSKIDEIAMAFGVQQALDAQNHVERNVIVPQSARMPGAPHEEDDSEF